MSVDTADLRKMLHAVDIAARQVGELAFSGVLSGSSNGDLRTVMEMAFGRLQALERAVVTAEVYVLPMITLGDEDDRVFWEIRRARLAAEGVLPVGRGSVLEGASE